MNKASRAALHKAGPQDLERLVGLIGAFHAEEELDSDAAHIVRAIKPLLEGSPHGEIFLAGPRMSPVGYIASAYGWSIEFGGMDAFIDEFYLRPAVRGRGIAGDVLHELSQHLAAKGVFALHLEVDHENEIAIAAYKRSGFLHRARYGLMTRTLT